MMQFISRLPDELLSSWLVRVSMKQGCDPLALTSCFWPQRRVWATDLDRGTIGRPHDCAGLSESDFSELTLAPIASKVAYGTGPGEAVWPWILAAGCRNRRRHGGLQFCPECLAADTWPYYRRCWRLAWHTSCLKHGCMLMDRCGVCGRTPEPHRLTLANTHLALCATCGADFRTQISPLYDLQAARFQLYADHAVEHGEVRYGDTVVLTAEWFRLARFLVALLRAAGRAGHQCFSQMFERVGMGQASTWSPLTGLPLELLPTYDRMALLAPTYQVLNVELEALVDAALSSGITRGALLSVGGHAPPCLDVLVSALPQGTSICSRKPSEKQCRPRSRVAVERMVARLKRKARW